MKIEFWLRTPGNHNQVSETNITVIPRVGESVQIHSQDRVREVHSVTHFIDKGIVKVLLRDD